jgi:hypothetical protein
MSGQSNPDEERPDDTPDSSRGPPLDRRRFVTGATAMGLGSMGAVRPGIADEGVPPGGEYAPLDHDHSGEFGTPRNVGTDAPVESVRTDVLLRRDAPVVDVTAHGAAGDGGTDDHAAIQAAVDGADDGSVVYFPPGIYRVSEPVTARDKSLTVRGAGMGVTRVEFTGGTDGFVFTHSGQADTDDRYVAVTDLSLGTTEPASGAAIAATWADPPAGAFPHLAVEQVNVRNPGSAGADDRGFFTTGVLADNATRIRIVDCHMIGHVFNIGEYLGDPDDPEIVGIDLQGRTDAASISAVHFSRCDVGIRVGSPGTAGAPEDVRMHEATLVDCVRGVEAHDASWVTFTSSHFNGRQTGVHLEGCRNVTVSDCLFYVVQWSEYDWTGVRALDSSDVHVSNLSVGDLAKHDGLHRGVLLRDCGSSAVEGNVVNGLFGDDNAVVELDGSRDVTVVGNLARDAEWVTKLTAAASDNVVFGNRGAVDDAGASNLVADNLTTRLLAQRNRNNVPENTSPPRMGMQSVADTYGQTFTAEEDVDMVEMEVANFFNETSAATVTLFAGTPLDDDDLEEIDSERREMWPNVQRITFDFSSEDAGTFYLEMSEPQGTPTWWWYEVLEGDDEDAEEGLVDIGGRALLDRVPPREAPRYDRPVEKANFWITAYGA